MVVKWLPMQFKEYLELGSLLIDFSQEGQVFIPTVLGNIDVGEIVHNFKAHKSDRSSLGASVINT